MISSVAMLQEMSVYTALYTSGICANATMTQIKSYSMLSWDIQGVGISDHDQIQE